MEIKRSVFHVVPVALPVYSRAWGVRLEGREELLKVSTAKGITVAWAKSICQDLARQGVPSQVIIHLRDGTIETEHTYLKDPKETRG